MDALQMWNEFEIVYEAIASGDAPGYDPYEVSIILSEAQEQILKEILETGAESNDIKSLVIGPFIEVDTATPTTAVSAMYPDSLEFNIDTTSFWAILNERLKETDVGVTVEVKPIDHDFWAANKDNPYKQPSTDRHFWRLLQAGAAGTADTLFIITGASAVHTYYTAYLDRPDPIIMPSVLEGTIIDGTSVTAGMVITGLASAYSTIIHRDVVNRAAINAAAYTKNTESFQLLKAKYSNK